MKGLRRPASFAVSVALHSAVLIIASRLPMPLPRETVIAVELVAAVPAGAALTGSPAPAEEPVEEPDSPPAPELLDEPEPQPEPEPEPQPEPEPEPQPEPEPEPQPEPEPEPQPEPEPEPQPEPEPEPQPEPEPEPQPEPEPEPQPEPEPEPQPEPEPEPQPEPEPEPQPEPEPEPQPEPEPEPQPEPEPEPQPEPEPPPEPKVDLSALARDAAAKAAADLTTPFRAPSVPIPDTTPPWTSEMSVPLPTEDDTIGLADAALNRSLAPLPGASAGGDRVRTYRCPEPSGYLQDGNYPERMAREGTAVVVDVTITVNARGAVTAASIEADDESGFPTIDIAALQVARACRFDAKLGAPDVRRLVPITFDPRRR